ncbi:NAD-dependent epimerase/dehydratase family protein [Actinokineospora sp.]|uniref:NAD-dependent epimerase/dehydratase family protein n=1 Tax=Actinokineospora sp. TaxID=1872133 RepID=UPI003D6B9DDA
MTGATGFVGGHLTSRLIALGAEVHAVTRGHQTQRAHSPAWHVVDLADAEAVSSLLRSTAPDVVFHLASAVTGTRDAALVRAVLDANLISAVNLLTAAVGAPGIRLVLAGSVEETRDAEVTPSSPYAAAKSAATAYARMCHQLWDVAATVLRVAMVYGPDQPDTTKLIPYTILALLRGEDPELSSGTRLVDWVYVGDVVEAFLAAADTDKAAGQVLDVGSGTQVSIRDTIELLAAVIGGSGRPRFGAIADRPLDHAQMSDPRPTAEILRWRPETGLEEGLRRTVAWYAADRMES